MHKMDDDVARYFRALGYEVSWDFDKHDGAHWYEIIDPKTDRLIMQIDMGVPLAHIIEDMICWHEGRKATSKSNYDVRGNKNRKAYKAVLAAVAAAQGEKT